MKRILTVLLTLILTLALCAAALAEPADVLTTPSSPSARPGWPPAR